MFASVPTAIITFLVAAFSLSVFRRSSMKSCLHYTERQFVEKEIKRNETIIVFETKERQRMGLAIFKYYLQCCTPVYRAHTSMC